MLRYLVLALKGHNKSAQGIALGALGEGEIPTHRKPCKGGTTGRFSAIWQSHVKNLIHLVWSSCFGLSGQRCARLTYSSQGVALGCFVAAPFGAAGE